MQIYLINLSHILWTINNDKTETNKENWDLPAYNQTNF